MPRLIQPNFKRPFCLDVDYSPQGVGVILSQKEGKFEKVVAYASKSLREAQIKFHPMGGECYALIWGICILDNTCRGTISFYGYITNHLSGQQQY